MNGIFCDFLKSLWDRVWLLRPIIFLRSCKIYLKKVPYLWLCWTIGQKYGQKSRARWTENNKDKKLRALRTGQKKIVRTIFCPDKFFFLTIFFVWTIFCPNNFFVRTKGHLPPSRSLPIFFSLFLIFVEKKCYVHRTSKQ